jgi:hypothetical protein
MISSTEYLRDGSLKANELAAFVPEGWHLYYLIVNLKGQCHKIFDFWFFHETVSPKRLSIPLRPSQIFSKIRGDIRGSRCTTGVADTGGK